MWQGENFGVALKALAARVEADRPALIHGERVVSFKELDAQSDAIAADLLARGFQPGDIAGQMLRNTPDYLLAFFGAVKGGLVPVNVNYHYKDRELADICQRFGMKALFAESDFADAARAALGDDGHAIDVGSAGWRSSLEQEPPADFAIHSDPEALFLTATGGTTGMPKAVMWPFTQSWQANSISVWQRGFGEPPFVAQSLEEQIAEAVKIGPDHPASTSPTLLLSPLMHGAGQFYAIIQLLKGGTLAFLPTPKFDAATALSEIKRLQAKTLFMVGDAFAMPMADALEAHDDPETTIASLAMVISTGAAFSAVNKERLIAYQKALVVVDALGSSESSGTATIITTAAGSSGGGKFAAMPGRNTRLFDADLNEIKPGEDGIGIVARSGPLPLGYLGEDEKNAATFPVIDGVRYLMTGDQARWAEDGTLDFIGRDNMCINTGGEKVFPEEVEAVLLAYSAVEDARVVSLPDPRFGRKIVAVVKPEGAAEDTLEASLDAHARAELAGYKIPRLYVFTQGSLRLNNGKPDYKTAQKLADEAAANAT